MDQTSDKPKDQEPRHSSEQTDEVIAHRRSCEIEGTGLSHYILPSEKEK
ncbi:MAG TPA: modified peptide precursor CbpA [Polyangiaceae bacterium]|nr:modified peptide precursor CbpA [Polyangiaceae bacterium]